MDWTQYDQLKAQGLADREIARQWGIVWSTLHREKQKREPTGVTVPENQGQNTEVHSSTPTSRQRHTQVYPSTPNLPAKRSTTVYPRHQSSSPPKHTRAYQCRMMRPCACCLCFLTWR
jgi:IS30 family transposase